LFGISIQLLSTQRPATSGHSFPTSTIPHCPTAQQASDIRLPTDVTCSFPDIQDIMSLISSFLKPLSEMDTNSRKRKADGHAEDGHKVVVKTEPSDGVTVDIKTEELDDSAIDDTADDDRQFIPLTHQQPF
jgi:hypothetical protein